MAEVPNGTATTLKKALDRLKETRMAEISKTVKILKTSQTIMLSELIDDEIKKTSETLKLLGYEITLREDGRRVDGKISKEEPPTEGQEKIDDPETEGKAKEIIKQHNDKLKKTTAEIIESSKKSKEAVVKSQVSKEFENIRQVLNIEGYTVPDNLNDYLKRLEEAVLKFILNPPPEPKDGGEGPSLSMMAFMQISAQLAIGVHVDNTGLEHPPVIVADDPTLPKMHGKNYAVPKEGNSQYTDHTMYESGYLAQANHGVLIVDLERLLARSQAIGLHKFLFSIIDQKLTIESSLRLLGIEEKTDFYPENLKLDVRVILVCDFAWGHPLRQNLPLVNKAFGVNVEIEPDWPVYGAIRNYADFAALCERESPNFLPISPEAIAKTVEFGIRLARNQSRATARLGRIKRLWTEANHRAKEAGAKRLEGKHIQETIRCAFDRQALIIRQYERNLDEGLYLWSRGGYEVGQANGLVVIQVSEEAVIGAPKRITGQAYAGKKAVTLVQDEVQSSGKSTKTALAIIRGYLKRKFGKDRPLPVEVQLCMEQCYGGVDGDSATLVKLSISKSALSGIPLNQGISVTGSMNQHGQVQPIGGVNHKIHGHFYALKRQGLLDSGGEYGVIIPMQNISELMLDEEVVEAVKEGKYSVWAVSEGEDVSEILMDRSQDEVDDLIRQELDRVEKIGKNKDEKEDGKQV